MNGLVVDLFAGGGGASVGLEAALGRPVDLAINHDRVALAVHRANHPRTEHLDADIWEVRPREATRGRPVDVLWASPDCTHFSVAKGGKPRKQNIRSLAWVVTRWAKEVRPRLIFLENVSEFRGWGPLGPDGQPDKSRMGETFRRWLARLQKLGYQVDYRVLDASLYGAPTRRRRLFLIARRDGLPIVWPEATHGAGKGLLPLHTAAECIDWSIPCPSIFDRKKPLAPKTLWRIAQGLKRFVFNNPRPFILKFQENSLGQAVEEPLHTVMAGAQRFGVVAPLVVGVGGRAGQSEATTGDAAVGTITAKNDRALVIPHLVEMNHANAAREVEAPLGVVTTQHNRFNLMTPVLASIDQQSTGESAASEPAAPLSTIVTKARHVVVAPHLVKVNHGGADEARGESIEAPLSTVTATQRGHAVAAATLIQTGYGERDGQAARALDLEAPLGTVVAGGRKHAVVETQLINAPWDEVLRAEVRHLTGERDCEEPVVVRGIDGKDGLVSAFVAKHFGDTGQRPGSAADEPVATITASDHNSLVAANLVKLRGECHGADLEEPMPTVTASGFHVAEVRAFLTAYYGQDGTEGKGQSVLEPMRTLTAKARLGLVTVAGVDYQVVDIGMRMLEPHELLRAQFGRFEYDLSAAKTKAAKVRLIGNSVCPEIAEAIVRANAERLAERRTA